jgi:hypothetical protein
MYKDIPDLGPRVQHVVVHSLQTEFNDENFIKQYHAEPRQTKQNQGRIIAQTPTTIHEELNLIKVYIYTFLKIV